MKIGIPAPQVMAPFVGVVEIVCGVLIVLGVLTRFAAIALIIGMLVAISTTKFPILLKSVFWAMAHEARMDYAMLLGTVFLLIVGAGRVPMDTTYGVAWFLGSAAMGFLYDKSITTLIIFSVVAQLAALPVFFWGTRESKAPLS